MKREFTNKVAKMTTLTLFLLACTVCTFAQESRRQGGGRLAGTWDATVRIKDCASGNVLNTFASIASFDAGGTSIGSTSGLPQSSRTPEHGIWRHLYANLYEFKFKTFSFNAAGQATGYAIIQHTLELNHTADEYYSDGTARFYLLNGTQVGQGCSDAVGTRFDF